MVDRTPLFEVSSLAVSFGAHDVLAGVDLTVGRGEIVSVLGKSGAGKSVLLQCLAGLLSPDSGEIRFDGIPLPRYTRRDRTEFRRRCSYLFQHNALLDSLTALENVSLPLEQTTQLSSREIYRRAQEALARLDLAHQGDRYPSQMSGGMQKRLALARAIVTSPEIVLFDEPTAGLDPIRRNAVFVMIARYQRAFGFTALVVTHDIAEAVVVSDRVALLDGGQIRFCGPPEAFQASAEPIVAAFRESTNSLRGTLASMDFKVGELQNRSS